MALERNQVISNDALSAPLELSKNLNEVTKSLKEIIAVAGQMSQAIGTGNATQKKQREVVDELTRANERLKKANSDVAKEVAKINLQTQTRNKELKEEAKASLGLVGAYDKLTKELNDARNAYKNLAASGTATNKALKEQQAIVNILDKRVKAIDSSVGQFQRNVGNYPKTFLSAANALKGFLGAFGLVGGVQLLATALKDIVRINREFEKSLSTLSAITGATGKDLEFYKNEAIDVGIETGKSAKDVVEAYKLIGSAKADLLANKEALAAVTREAIILSQASGDELPTAAAALAAALNQFQLPAEEAARVINTIAAGSKAGAVEVPQITEAIERFGSVARNSNISIEESVALIEAIGPAGLIGAEGGTKLRNILVELQSGADDTNPAVVGLNKALENLAGQQLTTTQLSERFNIQNLTAIQTLIEQREEVARLTKEVTGTNVAYEQAAVATNNLDTDIEKLTKSWEALVLTFSKTGPIREVVQIFTSFILTVRGLGAEISTLFKVLTVGPRIVIQGLANTSAELAQSLGQVFDNLSEGADELNGKVKASIDNVSSSLDNLKNSIKGVNKELDNALALGIDESSKEYLELLKFKLQSEVETNKKIVQDDEQTAKARVEASQKAFLLGRKVAELNKEIALKDEELTVEQKILIHEKYLAELRALESKNAEDRNKILANAAKDQLKELNKVLANRRKFEVEVEKSTDTEIAKIAKTAQERFEKNIDKRVDKAKEAREAELKALQDHEDRKQAIQEASIALGEDISNGLFENRQARLDNELQISQDRRQKELDAAGDDERRKLAINKKFDREQAKIKTKQAQADKQQALFNIAIQTAINVAKYVGGLPFTAPLLALAIATGAIQAALVASRPIPKFWKGSDSTPDTFIAGDRGRELVVHDGKAMVTPNKSTLFTGMEGAVVFPHPRTEEILGSVEDADVSRSILRSLNNNQAVSWSRIETQLEENNKILRTIANRPTEDLYIDEKGFNKRIRKGQQKLNNYYKRFGEWT